MSLESVSDLSLIHRLKDRAKMLKKARAFFEHRQILEVDCPILSPRAAISAHIDLIEGKALGQKVFLHSSPEYGMKRLLAMGIQDIFQLSHVFRDHELGEKHHPEFLMAEWYRVGFSFESMMQETADFIYLFLEDQLPSSSFETLSYRDAFLKFCSWDIDADKHFIQQWLEKKDISYPKEADKMQLLHFCYAFFIEPNLGLESLMAIIDYPPEEAALARIVTKGNHSVAERFEFYFRGMELANGYHELAHKDEQKRRFEEDNKTRSFLGKDPLPRDDFFLDVLDCLPDCCGVAVGVDRLMMLRHNVSDIRKIIPFAWEKS